MTSEERQQIAALRSQKVSDLSDKLDRAKATVKRVKDKAKEAGTGVIVGAAVAGAAAGYSERLKADGKPYVPEKFMVKADGTGGIPTILALAAVADTYVIWTGEKNPMIQGVAGGLSAVASYKGVKEWRPSTATAAAPAAAPAATP